MTDVAYFFDGWEPIVRILIVGTLSYVALLVILRTTGSRTLANLRTYDFVVTVAIGAVFGRTITAREIPLIEVVVALALLVVLQNLLSLLKGKSEAFASLLTDTPTLLYYRGECLHAALRTCRVTEADLYEIARQRGYASLEEVGAIVLETNGELSVIGKDHELGALESLSSNATLPSQE